MATEYKTDVANAILGGIEYAVKKALMASGRFIPWQIVTISTDRRVLD